MPAVARIESSLGFRDAEFVAGIARAEKRAQTFGARMEHSLERAFRRDPARRAERAITGGLASLAQGDVAGAIGSITGKMAGMGVAVGVGLGLAVEGFAVLKHSVDEVSEARDKLDVQMRKPLGLSSAKELGAALDDLKKKQSTLAHGFIAMFTDIAHQKGFQGLTDLGKTRMEEESDNAKALARQHEAESLEGRRTLVQGRVIRGLEDDPLRKARAEKAFEFEKRERELRANPNKGTLQEIANLNEEWNKFLKDSKEGVANVTASEERRFATAKKLINLQRSGLEPDMKKKLEAQIHLGDVTEDLKNTHLSVAERHNLEIEKLQQESILKPNKPQRSAFDFGRNRWDEELQSRSDSNFGSIENRWKDTPANDETSPDILAELVKFNANMEKFWGSN